jgi:hypothetical protein
VKNLNHNSKPLKFSSKNVFLENKAQSEVVFRLLIDSIIGLAILLIIISSISYFQEQAIVQDRESLVSLIRSAVNSPDGKIFTAQNLTFKEGFSISSINTQTWTGMSMNCLTFDALSPSVKIGEGQTDNGATFSTLKFERLLMSNVYARCSPAIGCNPRIEPATPNDCCVNCLVSFGKKIE